MATDRVNNGPTITPPALSPIATPAGPAAPAAPAHGIGGAGAGGAKGAKKNYDVQISDRAKTNAAAYQKALGIAKATPDVREDRIAALKKQIADGTYQPDAGKIADGMLVEAIKDHLAQHER